MKPLAPLKRSAHVKQAEELGMKKRVFCFWELEASNFGLDAFTNPNKAYCILASVCGLKFGLCLNFSNTIKCMAQPA